MSYLNTTPLVWGMLHGPQAHETDVTFSIPAVCAQQVEGGYCDIGLVPVAEISRQHLEVIPGVGIAALGAVRSILLFAKKPWRQVRTLAADLSSRTSVQLARVILRERFGVEPEISSRPPALEQMLEEADSALLIGDAALRIVPGQHGYEWLDLGAEWHALTQLPMVFAAWAGKPGIPAEYLSGLTTASYEYGKANLSHIVAEESARRGFAPALVDEYLRSHIRFPIGPKELEGMHTFLRLAKLEGVAA